MLKWNRWVALTALLAGVALSAPAAGTLQWNAARGRVSADVKNAELNHLLEQIAAATGWQIFLEPGTERSVSASFTNQLQGEALRYLLGDINYALVPQSTGPRKLFVFKTTLNSATRKVEPKIDTSVPIPNELLVRVKPGTDINQLAQSLGGKVIGEAKDLSTYRLRFETKEAADRARELLQANEEVTAIGSNYYFERSPDNNPFASPPPGAPSGPPIPKASGNSEQTIIGLIDTGVQLTGGDYDQFLLPTISVAGESPAVDGVPTHATAMYQTMLQSIAANASPDGSNAKILPIDVYGTRPNTTTFDVANGIFEAINNGATIINLSLGSEGDSGYLRAVIEAGLKQGVTFIGAAGNSPVANPTYPAAYPGVISVTSSNPDGSLASYANTGEWVDTIAPGTTRLYFDGRVWQTSGTSVSAAWLSGWISAQPSPREAATRASTQFAR